MTWVKLGEERVNTDKIVKFLPAVHPKNTVGVWMDSGIYSGFLDPDGALLRALDAVCFPMAAVEMVHEHQWMTRPNGRRVCDCGELQPCEVRE